MSEKKILIITYYWPPSGGSGVQRWLKFVKYLPEHGYIPYVFTPENPSFDIKDESLLKDVPSEAEVIHFPIWEPYGLFGKTSGASGSREVLASSRKTSLQRLAVWIRGNLIIPDPRVFWVRPSIKFLTDFVRDNNIKIIVTTGPPHSIHLIGRGLKRKNRSLTWIADFRDPWSTWGLLDTLQTGPLARKAHRYLEWNVLTKADKVITITPFYARKFKELSGRHVELITNGFDETDFKNFTPRRTEKFIIRHVGIVNEKCNPRPFMNAVKKLLKEDQDFSARVRIDFVGNVHPDFRSFVLSDDDLKAVTSFTPPVSHDELIHYYSQSSLLLIVLTGYKDAEGYMPGKLFEYVATGLPVVGTGPVNGDAAALLRSAGAGDIIDSDAEKEIIRSLKTRFDEWVRGDQPSRKPLAEKFSRRGITQTLVDLLERTI